MTQFSNQQSLPVGVAATLACLYEATAAKPGNVHPRQAFDDTTTYAHFVQSAVVSGPIVGQARELGVGRAVLDAVRATRDVVGTNTNLGTLLLLAPLAAVPAGMPLAGGIGAVLKQLNFEDTRHVYDAIRISSAGGLGRAERADVFDDAPTGLNLVEVMRLAADRDLIARQYINEFADVFDGPAAWIEEGISQARPLTIAIIHAHVRQMAKQPDSLILRKCGPRIAAESRDRAAEVIAAGLPGEASYDSALNQFDMWLRADGHQRNPGTTADLIAAGLFVLLREGRLDWKKIGEGNLRPS
jgi:triphosphoribosyl-dephospho-CoA synthase